MECFRLLLAVLAALAGARVAVCPVVGRGARPDGARPPPLRLLSPMNWVRGGPHSSVSRLHSGHRLSGGESGR
jgi:hypothetical protein